MNELSKETRALIDELGRADEPSEADVERNLVRVRAALQVGAVAAATTAGTASSVPASAPAASGATLGTLGSKLALSAIVGGGVIAAALTLGWPGAEPTRTPPTRTPPTRSAAAPTPTTRDAPVVVEDLAPPSPEVVEERLAPREEERSVAPEAPRASTRRSPTPSAATPPDSAPERAVDVTSPETAPPTTIDRSAELALLVRAQRLLGSGDAGGALVLFDDALAAHPSGALREEAEAGRVLSLCALHRPDASGARDDFLAAHPRSPSVVRIVRECP